MAAVGVLLLMIVFADGICDNNKSLNFLENGGGLYDEGTEYSVG